MLNRNTFLSKFQNVSEGMSVYSQDGEKLGKVIAMDEDSFTVEKGFFFPKDFTARYDDIVDVRDGDLILNSGLSDLNAWRNENYSGWNDYETYNRTEPYVDRPINRATTPLSNAETSSTLETAHTDFNRPLETPSQVSQSSEVRIPVSEEKLEAVKVARQAGEVRLRKVVHTELKHLTVPVSKEEVVVERTPVNEVRDTSAKDIDFRDETISVPVMEEEIEIRKRPVVKEEIRIKKEARTEERTVSGEVRSEEVKVEDEGSLKKRKAG